MSDYRFRIGESGELVLQVLEIQPYDNYSYPHERKANWRDATIADIPVSNPFARRPPTESDIQAAHGMFT